MGEAFGSGGGSRPRRDGTLARQFAAGDEQAAAVVLERAGRIVGFRGFGIPREDRRDIQQQVVTEAWRAAQRPDFDFEEGFWGFVETIAARRCIDWMRAERPRAALEPELPDRGRDPLATLLSHERVELARAALSQLDPACRDLIELHAGQQKTYREIAEVVGDSEGALRVRLHRCVKQARAMLEALSSSAPADGRDG